MLAGRHLSIAENGTSSDFRLITLETPEGRFEGIRVRPRRSAAAAFEAVYVDAGWRGHATVEFTGGLVDTGTSRDLPNERKGLYRLTAKQAQRINWDDAELIDWSVYRDLPTRR